MESQGSSGAGSASKGSEAKNQMEILKERTAKAAADKDKVMKEKMARIQAGLEAEKKKRKAEMLAAAEAKKSKADEDDPGGLYGGLPEADPELDAAFAQRLQEKGAFRAHRFPPLKLSDESKAIFLDVDGVLRPQTAGGFRAMMVDGEWTLKAETADFISASMLALRHILEETGSLIVLSSEWRRDEPMREGVNKILVDYEMPQLVSWTATDLQRDMGTENPFQAFIERRAREISTWVKKNPQVKQWVVLDDINMATADEDRKEGTLPMTPRIVQTHRRKGLTYENAQAAVQILNGEKLPPQVLKVQPEMQLL